MKTVKIVIEKSSDMYSAYAENVEGIYGGGDTPAEARESILEAIRITKEINDPKDIPSILKGDYTLVYGFDVRSLLEYYKGIFTNSALERITGINQKQLQHYASGLKKPRIEQKRKIEEGLHRIAAELQTVTL
ncbi:type II toxin-antitoxin system HicB family antitoxin [Pedobacter sp. HDW13]|uniref:type II toxin-antitoxin system HicB family antitoxin n=1 Tax=Pedobacter sp. HDW13 TaxID=2714940 RepID=UPI0014085178|nr:type II toxin-antitoxin system HicB family antitoxin [Pedobacter sp. HDW13]QIL41010.1 type II toxin-antitoxin system HicB family antitoxin [Pedobacter sp. HDW13]